MGTEELIHCWKLKIKDLFKKTRQTNHKKDEFDLGIGI